MKHNMARPVSFPFLLSCLFLIVLITQCHIANDQSDQGNKWLFGKQKSGSLFNSEKQRGAHIFGRIDSSQYKPFQDYHIEWFTLVPWGFQDDYDSKTMSHHNGDSLYIVKSDSNWVKRIQLARDAGFKVFVKPHIWMDIPSDEKWRSDIFPQSDEHWEAYKASYRNFIIRYAKIAEKSKAEMFCIGTELTRLSTEKSTFFESLIEEVRTIYSGKLTYAANWYEEYEHITFWDKLDYIGIQAYFPLVKTNFPDVEQLSKGWKKYLPTIESLSKKYNRKVIFTEMGYKSTSDSGIKPWEWIENPYDEMKNYSLETQANCYQAFFNTVWGEKWFAGVHIWQLRADERVSGRANNMDFTPKGKPAERIITKGFGNGLAQKSQL